LPLEKAMVWIFSAKDGKQALEEASEVTNLCPTDYYVSIVKKKYSLCPVPCKASDTDTGSIASQFELQDEFTTTISFYVVHVDFCGIQDVSFHTFLLILLVQTRHQSRP
jgi:hypothetical protein